MRLPLLLIATALLTACATQTAPSGPAPVTAPAQKPAKPGPQCWSGDHGAFFDVGTKTSLSGVPVECQLTSDGKSAQWMGNKK